MHHSFSVEIAKEYSLNAAIIYHNFQYWVNYNETKNLNFHDGEYWTYNSVKEYKKFIPYLTDKQVRTAIEKLEKAGLIKSANYNKTTYDRTKWYTICPQRQMEETSREIGDDTQGKPIPDDNPDSKPEENKKEEKVRHLDCVDLTTLEYNSLVEKYGDSAYVDQFIEELNNYKMSNGKKYKSDYHTMIGWVYKKFIQDKPKGNLVKTAEQKMFESTGGTYNAYADPGHPLYKGNK